MAAIDQDKLMEWKDLLWYMVMVVFVKHPAFEKNSHRMLHTLPDDRDNLEGKIRTFKSIE